MNKALDLKFALTELFRSGANGEHDEQDMVELLDGIDFHALLQTVYNSAETVYAYHSFGALCADMEYYGPELLPQKATLIYEDMTDCTAESAICTRSLELWLLPDMSFAVTSCFTVSLRRGGYVTEYRTLKDTNWRDAGMLIDFLSLADDFAVWCEQASEEDSPLFEV